jgi:hypothetical protein
MTLKIILDLILCFCVFKCGCKYTLGKLIKEIKEWQQEKKKLDLELNMLTQYMKDQNISD